MVLWGVWLRRLGEEICAGLCREEDCFGDWGGVWEIEVILFSIFVFYCIY